MIQFDAIVRNDETFEYLWPIVQRFGQYTLYDGFDTREQYASRFFNEQSLYYWAIEDGQRVGYVSGHYDTPWSMTVHALFWDRRTRTRIKQVHKLCQWVMRKYNLELIRTILPTTRRTSIAFAQRMGFTIDGIARSAAKQNGKNVDLVLLTLRKGDPYNARNVVTTNDINERGDYDERHDGRWSRTREAVTNATSATNAKWSGTEQHRVANVVRYATPAAVQFPRFQSRQAKHSTNSTTQRASAKVLPIRRHWWYRFKRWWFESGRSTMAITTDVARGNDNGRHTNESANI